MENLRSKGTGDAFDELYQQVDRIGGTHIVVFDEIDHLKEANTLLYELPHARANGHVSDAKVGVIGISNDYTFRRTLSPKVKDTLMETVISFSPYDAGELRTILEHRAERAFVDEACDPSAIANASALAAQDMGNARQALDLLRVGAELAERNGETPVTDDHIEAAREQVQRGRLENKTRDQTEHAQYILEAIANLQTQGEVPARSKEIQQTYEEVADSHAASPLSTLKSIQDHLSDLHMLGFLRRHGQNKRLSGGQYYEYELDLDPEIILQTRQKSPDIASESKRNVLSISSYCSQVDTSRKAHEIHSLSGRVRWSRQRRNLSLRGHTRRYGTDGLRRSWPASSTRTP